MFLKVVNGNINNTKTGISFQVEDMTSVSSVAATALIRIINPVKYAGLMMD